MHLLLPEFVDKWLLVSSLFFIHSFLNLSYCLNVTTLSLPNTCWLLGAGLAVLQQSSWRRLQMAC